MDRNQLRELHARGHVIGSHTVTHPNRMSALPYADLRYEWTESCALLSDILGAPIQVASVAICYSGTVGRAAQEAGIGILFNSEPSTAVGRLAPAWL